MRNFSITWENIFFSFFFTIGVLIVGIIFTALTSDHKVRHYYLCGSYGTLEIRGDINWGDDIQLSLDRNISYNEAIQMLNDLNKTLK